MICLGKELHQTAWPAFQLAKPAVWCWDVGSVTGAKFRCHIPDPQFGVLGPFKFNKLFHKEGARPGGIPSQQRIAVPQSGAMSRIYSAVAPN
jgi:hypothetical protein